ncbi:MAG: hypothetical protein HY822_19785 [Acidobacteria bacterium]|nr:hypothetical protein [Acidobacteriota bacterium]
MFPIFLALGLAQPSPDIDRQTLARLLDVKRVYVDRLAGGDPAIQIRDMIIASLQGAKLFILTENQERADAVLKGSAEDLVFTDTFQSSEGLSARASAGAPARSGSTTTSSSRRVSASLGISDQESTRIAERKHEAVAAVRLVSKEGDVLWSTTQESLGAKFKGSSADVAEKITKQLQADFDRARRLRSGADANQLAR